MAHTLLLPVAFEFRQRMVVWESATAEVLGWWNELEPDSGIIGNIGKADDIAVRILTSTGNNLGIPFQRKRFVVQMARADMPTSIIGPLDTPEKWPRLAAFWGERRLEMILSPPPIEESWRLADAWAMREEFLDLPQDNSALLGFLNKWGYWDERRLFPREWPPYRRLDVHSLLLHCDCVLPHEMWELQTKYRAALTKPAKDWLSKVNAMTPPPMPRDEYPYFLLARGGCRRAIETTITADKLRKLKFRRCARPDCQAVFEIMSDHKRKFCCQYCGHLESIRKRRREEAKRKRKIKAQKGA